MRIFQRLVVDKPVQLRPLEIAICDLVLDSGAINGNHATDIVNIGLHFILKNIRPYAASCSEA